MAPEIRPQERPPHSLAYRIMLALFIASFFTMLLLPVMQNLSEGTFKKPLFTPHPLIGVELPTDYPRLSKTDWFSGKFQTDFDQWFGHMYGLRDHLVRSANQLSYSVFGELLYNVNAPVIVGKDGSLINLQYIPSALGSSQMTDRQLDELVMSVRRLQDLLAKRGVKFILFVTPSKPSVEPEIVPDYYDALKSPAGLHPDYARLMRLVQKYEITSLDSRALVVDLQKTSGFRAFPKGGVHWNYFMSLAATEGLIESVEKVTGKALPHLRTTQLLVDAEARGSDGDLARLINVWRTDAFIDVGPYPLVERVDTLDAYKPNVLGVGASFFSAPWGYLADNEIISKDSIKSWYFSEGDAAKLSILTRDVVILECNEAVVAQVGFGFIPSAIKVLEEN